MRYLVRQRFWSWLGDAFDITGGGGRLLYRVRRDGKRIAFCAPSGDEAAALLEVAHNRWVLSVGGVNRATAAFVRPPWRGRFEIQVPVGVVEIEHRGRRFEIAMDGARAATVRRRFFFWTDAFRVEVASPVEPLFALGLAVVIALVNRS